LNEFCFGIGGTCRKSRKRAFPVREVAMPAVVRLPITNIFMGGDYTASLAIGAAARPVNLILDTGSSSFAINGDKYIPDPAGGDVTTNLAQTETYGSLSWTGSVIETAVSIGSGASAVTLPKANATIIYEESQNIFQSADGILGLAYAELDDAFEMPLDSWAHKYSATEVRQGKPKQLTPFLTQLNDADVTSDVISFLTRRSFIHQGGGGANDPLNQGWAIIGGGEECHDLYTGDFQSVKVVSEDWYSTVLKAVIVGTSDPIAARLEGPAGMASNSIIDSGTNSLRLGPQLIDAILAKFSADQRALLAQSIHGGNLVPAASLDLAAWPAISFVMAGADGDVALVVRPCDYWQVNTDQVGAALASISIGQPGMAILGLPLMNGYFTIFDGEADDGRGVVKFAAAKQS
jgi:hypothetical protein